MRVVGDMARWASTRVRAVVGEGGGRDGEVGKGWWASGRARVHSVVGEGGGGDDKVGEGRWVGCGGG